MTEIKATVTTVLPTAENQNKEQAKYSLLTKLYHGKATSQTPGILFSCLSSQSRLENSVWDCPSDGAVQ